MKEIIMLNIFICATISDLQNYKIKNPVIIAGWIASISVNLITDGIYGISNTIFCIIITIIIGLPLFMIGGIGAGDIKLLSVIGGIYGLTFLGKVTFLLLVLAGVISLVKLIRKKVLMLRVKAFIYYILHLNTSSGKYYKKEYDNSEFTICLAPIMAIAYFAILFSQKFL